MREKRFIRNIVGDIYDSEKGKWFEEDWEGKPLDYEDDLIVFLNEQQTTLQSLKEENEKLIQNKCLPCELVSLQVREIDKLKEENEQLRKKLEQIYGFKGLNCRCVNGV